MTFLKYIAIVVVSAAVGFAASQYFAPKASLGNAAGSTFSTAKFAGVVINLASPGAGATSTSILNTDAGTRYVTSYSIGCQNVGTSRTAYTGTGLANLLLTVGTTTTSGPAAIPAQYVAVNAATISTSTTAFASTTALLNGGLNSSWPSGTYETFWFNATNTALCTVGLSWFPS